MQTLLYFVITLALVLANAFFVASEFAIVKVRPTRLEQLIRGGDTRARLALDISHRLDAYLSATQLGVTLASLGLGWIGEPAIAHLVEPLFSALGRWAGGAAHVIGVVVAFIAITALHTIVGELAPKSFAIQRTEEMTLWAARPLWIFYHLAWPIIRLLNAGANGFVRLLGVKPAAKEELLHTSEELRILLTKSPAGLDPALRSMLVRIFDLRRRTARHVMTLRSDVQSMRAKMTIEEAVRFALDAGYSRYPVLDEAGTVLGYLHLRDLFEVLAGRRKATRVAELLRKPIFAREDTSVERLRLEMQARQTPVGIITSATSEFVGLVTIEDLVEEIVGEIRDEHEKAEVVRENDHTYVVPGNMDVDRLDELFHVRPDGHEATTVAGLVSEIVGRIPGAGEVVEDDGLRFEILASTDRRIERLRISVAQPKES